MRHAQGVIHQRLNKLGLGAFHREQNPLILSLVFSDDSVLRSSFLRFAYRRPALFADSGTGG
jgi:hypothetical protein